MTQIKDETKPSGTVRQGRRPMFKPFSQDETQTTLGKPSEQTGNARVRNPKKHRVDKLAYHRNGICGLPFHVALVRSDEGERMVVIRFDCDKEAGRVVCAALNIDKLNADRIEFGDNSYRGDHFADAMDDAIEFGDNSYPGL